MAGTTTENRCKTCGNLRECETCFPPKCAHKRTFNLGGKSSDRNSWSTSFSDDEGDGYVPRGVGLGGGDYYDITICIDCKQVVGLPDADAFLDIEEG